MEVSRQNRTLIELGAIRCCDPHGGSQAPNERLLIANLAKGRLGDDKSNLLGSLLVTQFQLAAMKRVNIPEEDRRSFYLFIDEFQNFSADSFVSILAEARKYGLSLVLSHQYVDQVPPRSAKPCLGT